MSEPTELVLTSESFPAISEGNNILDVIRFNLGGEDLDPSSLTKIKVPSGGSTTWLIPTMEGEKASPEIVGIIVNLANRRALWPSSDPTGEPPLCSSKGLGFGTGVPGGQCKGCPHDEFNSAQRADGTGGNGKACKERKYIYILRVGNFLPEIIDAPPASLKGAIEYLTRIGAKKLRYNEVVTRFTLKSEVNKPNKAGQGGGIKYAAIEMETVEVLPADMRQGMMAYSQQLQRFFDAVPIDRKAVGQDDDTAF